MVWSCPIECQKEDGTDMDKSGTNMDTSEIDVDKASPRTDMG